MKGWVGRPATGGPLGPRMERSPPTGTVREEEPRLLQSETTSASAVELRQPGAGCADSRPYTPKRGWKPAGGPS